GFKFYGIRPGSLPKLIGMKNGDMVTRVNGEALTSLDDAMELYTKLKTAKTIQLSIDRKGQSLAITLRFR
ncbi:MAG: PDZ domain-containing protein, partial [Myxococcales bacterium]|nr:PDZ domain-containing protein [Myxococcales bacterium]